MGACACACSQVLDEADRLLELGFKDEVEEVIKLCPKGRQTMFFSATISESVAALANLSLNSPVQVRSCRLGRPPSRRSRPWPAVRSR